MTRWRHGALVPVTSQRTGLPMWCFPYWRLDGLELLPIRSEIGGNATRWRLLGPGEALEEFTTYAKTLPRFIGQSEFAQHLVDSMYAYPYCAAGSVQLAYQNALRIK